MNLLRALATIRGMTLISRILGFVRDAVIARLFGAGLYTDAFFVAFRIPNLLRRLFAEGAFAQAFVPVLAEYKTREGEAQTRRLVDRTASMLRVTFPYIIFISLVSLAGGILNTWSRFVIPAFTPTVLNLSFIVCALYAAPYFNPPAMVLAWAVLLGGVLQLAIQLPALAAIGMLPRPSLVYNDPGVRRILMLMAPAVVGVSVGQISLLINTIFASFLESGSVSWLYYADRLMEFPTGLLGVALGTILLPSLAKLHSEGAADEYSNLLHC